MAEQALTLNVTANVADAKRAIDSLTASVRALHIASSQVNRTIQNIRMPSNGLTGIQEGGTAPTNGGAGARDANTLIRGYQQLVGSYQQLVRQIQRMGDTIRTRAEPPVSRFSKSWAKLRGELVKTGKGSSSIGKLTGQFMRLAKLRLLRSVISELGKGFTEGVQNVILYSRALEGLDSAAANPTMSQYATALLMVKNSIGAATAPLLQALLPTIQTVAGWFITAANAVNQFISALQGKSTFTKAKEYYVDYAESIDKSSKAAGGSVKKLRQLMDFDELNNITSPRSSGGGGGGGGADTPDYSEMFEESLIGSGILDKVKFIKDNFDEILEVAKVIGASILAWKFATKTIAAIDALKNLSMTSRLSGGLILSIAGIALAFEGGKMILEDGKELLGIITSALGTLAAGVGGYLLTTGLKAAGFAAIGGGAGFAIGIGVGLVATFIGMKVKAKEMGEQAFKESAFGKVVESIKSNAQKVIDNATQSLDNLKEAVDRFTASTANYDSVDLLIDRLYEIYESGYRGKDAIAEMKAITADINKLTLGELVIEYDNVSDSLSLTREEAQKAAAALRETAKAAAQQKLLEEAYEELTKAQVDHRKATEDAAKAQQAFDIANKQMTDYINNNAANGIIAFSSEYWKLNREVSEARSALDLANEAVEASGEAMDTAQYYITSYAGEMNDAADSADKATEKVEDVNSALNTVDNNIPVIDVLQGVSLNNAEQKLEEITGKLKDVGNTSPTVSVKTSGLDNVLDKVKSLWSNLKNIINNASVNISTGYTQRSVRPYASGGFPSQGSLFVAGETVGQTEWLGNINGKTGVVSGNEITGISQSIYATGEAEVTELRKQNALLSAILRKDLTISPSAGLGGVISQSGAMYNKVTGA